jgi:hypothetical protein
MKKCFGSFVPLCLAVAGFGFTATPIAAAQTAQATPPPNVLEIINESVKPGQEGGPHHKTESAFVQAMRSANYPTHYIGTMALSGSPRAIFFVGYDSFADYQKDSDTMMGNSSLAAQLDSANIADGALLSDHKNSLYTYREDLSLRAPVVISQMRYFDISVFTIRPGHEHDWEELVKVYADVLTKQPDAHWAMFEKQYGDKSGQTFIVVTPLKSLAEVDQRLTDDKKFADLAGPDQLKKLGDLAAASIDASESQLFSFDPAMSYVSDDWVKASPDFWGKK